MISDKVLKSSVIGYAYRGLRLCGIALTAAGVGLMGNIGYHSIADGQANATVTRLNVVCVLQGEGAVAEAIKSEVECGEAAATKAFHPKVPMTVGEVTYAHLQFHSEDGAAYEVRERLDVLGASSAEHGAIIPILYNRANPMEIRAADSMAALLQALSLLMGGASALFAVLTVRWIAGHRRGVEQEVAKLQKTHEVMVRQSLRQPKPVADKGETASSQSRSTPRRS